MERFRHLCSYPIDIAERWDGLHRYLEYRDGGRQSGRELVRHCPQCHDALTPQSFYKEDDGTEQSRQRLLETLCSWSLFFPNIVR